MADQNTAPEFDLNAPAVPSLTLDAAAPTRRPPPLPPRPRLRRRSHL